MTITTGKVPKDPLCEGWLEKLALRRGFSLLASKGWNRRYCFLTRRGLGYGHSNPREKEDENSKLPLRQSDAKCFIAFERHKGRETALLPVYYLRDVSTTKNPEVPSECVNGICTNVVPSLEDSKPRRYYYFAVTFEEKRKRYTLFLRTDSPQEYIKWTSYLPLYVHQASASSVVPYAHPLEVNRQPPVDMNRRRLVNKDSEAVSEGYYMRDPDPCTSDEYQTIRRRCLQWHEGERVRLIPAAKAYVRSHGAGSDVLATKALEEDQQLTFEQRLAQLDAIADALCMELGDDAPNSQVDVDECGDISAVSDAERIAAAAAANGLNDDNGNIVVGSAHDQPSAGLANGEAGAAAKKRHSRHKSKQKRGDTAADLNGGGKDAVPLYSNTSNTAPTSANKQQPSRLVSALLPGTSPAKDDDMKGSNDTNGRTPRVAKPRTRKKTRMPAGISQRDAAAAAADDNNNSANNRYHVEPVSGVPHDA